MITRLFMFASLAATAAFVSANFADASDSSVRDDSGSSPAAHDRSDRFAAFAKRKFQLTDAQATSLREIMRQHQSELQPLREQARSEREALRALVATQPLDEAALEAQATTMAATAKAMTIATAHLRADMRAVLTPGQIDTLMQARRQAAAHRQHRRQDLEAGLSEPTRG